MNQIARFIIKQVQEKSSGFQCVVSYEEVEERFGMETISEVIANAIADELGEHEEVADVELDEYGFDVVLYTDYAPNYTEDADFDMVPDENKYPYDPYYGDEDI